MNPIAIMAPVIAIAVYFLPLGLTPDQHTLSSIMVWVVLSWLNPHASLPMVGFLGLALTVILGVSDFSSALEGFSNPVIFLFMGGFMLAQAMSAHNLDRWIAARCLSMPYISGNARRVILAITIMTVLFSTLTSNTATAAMFIPITLSIFTELDIKREDPAFKLLLLVGYAATVGGIGTPLGSPPNVIGISLLDKMAGIKIGFFDWSIKMLPILVLCTFGLIALFYKELKSLPARAQKFAKPAPLESDQKLLSVLFIVTIFLWLFPGIIGLILGSNHWLSEFLSKRLPEGVVAIFMSSLLFVITGKDKKPLLSWEEARQIDWGTLLLFGCGISLGQLMFDTGLTNIIGQRLPFESLPLWASVLLITTVTLFATELMSNTATANLLVPLVISTPPFSAAPVVPVLCVCLAANMAFMLPVGTPPNAIIYATRKVELIWMIKKGFILNLICLAAIWGIGMTTF